ncbi:MAG: hypothetical protein V4472_09380 [Pseudomonadota bacterium]
MTEWVRQVRAQTRLVIDQLASMRARYAELGIDGEESLQSYYKMLEELYLQDFAVAEVRDNSDLVLRVEGSAFEHNPRLQLVTSIFENVTSQVTDLTKAILGGWADQRITPGAIDLGLTGVAKGSLVVGLSARPSPSYGRGNLLGDHDTISKSTRQALRIIDEVAHTIYRDSDSVSVEDVSEIVEDPRVRDAALVAIQRMSPSGRRGIETVSISGDGDSGAPATLNSDHRRAIRESLFKPVIRGEILEFTGQVREIDLDSRRFDLRGIANEQVRDVRCAYRNFERVNPNKLLGATVRVQGLVERTADEIPRLMSVTDIEIIRAPAE